jgi:hypothetical protein
MKAETSIEVEKLAGQSLPDVLLGARIKVFDADGDHSWHEGVVEAVKPIWNAAGMGECLLVKVDKRVLLNCEQVVKEFQVMVVDTDIPMTRVKVNMPGIEWR